MLMCHERVRERLAMDSLLLPLHSSLTCCPETCPCVSAATPLLAGSASPSLGLPQLRTGLSYTDRALYDELRNLPAYLCLSDDINCLTNPSVQGGLLCWRLLAPSRSCCLPRELKHLAMLEKSLHLRVSCALLH